MKLMVVSDAHIFVTPDGKFWCNTAMHGYDFWKRYTVAFSEVIVVARTKSITDEERKENSYILAEGPGVSFFQLPFTRGIRGYLTGGVGFIKDCYKTKNISDVAVFRIPSIPAYMSMFFFKRTKRPYSVEVVCDPENEYKGMGILCRISVALLRGACLKADGVSYVTQYYLQNKYPSAYRVGANPGRYFESYYSSIDLKKEFFCNDRSIRDSIDILKIVHIANSINNENKGHGTLLKIIENLKMRGVVCKVSFIGGGDLVDYYRRMAEARGLSDFVEFVGFVSDKDMIRKYLIEADLFVFPTRSEGLPRALIEAMAVGTPCLSTHVGGIPELLEKEYLFDYDDVIGFSDKIYQLVPDSEERRLMSEKNIEKALEYESSVLSKRRKEFYDKLRKRCCEKI